MASLQGITSDLIAFRTISPEGNELRCARYIFDYLKDLHSADSEINIQEFGGERANIVASFGATKEPGLLLSGHMDVVPSGDGWHTDPFRASAKEGKIVGRGAADMKGGLAAILKAVESVVKHGELRRRLVFVATAGEETGFVGLAKLIENSIVTSKSATCAVIGEPTDLRPARAHRGIFRMKVSFFGKSSHASTPEAGVNAVEYACKFVESIRDIRNELSQTRDNLLGVTTLTPTMIHGGIGENVIPPNAEVVLDSRRLPVHSAEYIRSRVEANCRALGIHYEISDLIDHKPLDTPEGNFLTKLAESITGEKSVSCAFGTEGSLYQGDLGIPTIALGPGSVAQAHVVDESVELAQLDRAVSIYSSFIQQICLQDTTLAGNILPK